MNMVETTILDGKVIVFQPEAGGLRVTIDTVFVAAACPAKAGERIADFGAGTGAAGLCAAYHAGGNAHVTFVEVQQDYADLCAHNARANNVAHDVVCADIRNFNNRHARAGEHPRKDTSVLPDVDTGLRQYDKSLFNHIVCNPPYLTAGTHFLSPDPKRQKALGEGAGDARLEDWIAAAARCLKQKGSFSMIHRADALDDILTLMKKYRFGAVDIWALQPYADKPAHRVIVRGFLGRKTKLTLHPAIILHDKKSAEKYTAVAEDILLGGQFLH